MFESVKTLEVKAFHGSAIILHRGRDGLLEPRNTVELLQWKPVSRISSKPPGLRGNPDRKSIETLVFSTALHSPR